MSGVAGIIIGPDANWDLRNYHIYNSYAFLEGRHAIDIAPAQRQSYHNPTAGLPLYALMFAFNEHPRLVAALMSLPYGIAIAAIAWLSSLVLPFSTMTEQVFRILAATVIGATGAATLGVIGSTMNEIPISTLIIFALAITCARLKKDNLNYGALFAVGFCVGIAGGLKLTYAVHGLAIGCALVSIVFLGKISIRELLVSALGVIVGLGLSSGWWFWHLYELFGNPVFP
ncbi:MAG: hypothetical protein LAT55_13115 [Opitutales bacterium]|nr:hypothetical protein [Opitutales bacterium]